MCRQDRGPNLVVIGECEYRLVVDSIFGGAESEVEIHTDLQSLSETAIGELRTGQNV